MLKIVLLTSRVVGKMASTAVRPLSFFTPMLAPRPISLLMTFWSF